MSRIKHILINFFLLAVFLAPQAIQKYHILTVHHHVTHCNESCSHNGKHFHKATEHCPIHDYVFSISDNIFIYSNFDEPKEFCEILVTEYHEQYKQNLFSSHFGRAPPIV